MNSSGHSEYCSPRQIPAYKSQRHEKKCFHTVIPGRFQILSLNITGILLFNLAYESFQVLQQQQDLRNFITIAIMKEYHSYSSRILLDLLSDNDETAFTEIYNRYWQKLFAIAYNRLKEAQEAEDIVHDVFASLWANRNKNQIESLDNYLAIAVKYMVLGKIKKKLRERAYSGNSQQAPVFELTVENSIHYKRILEIVKVEVEKLPEKCRLIFKYSRNDGMQVKQIAEELHISQKTVENQLNKAIKKLKLVTRTFFNF